MAVRVGVCVLSFKTHRTLQNLTLLLLVLLVGCAGGDDEQVTPPRATGAAASMPATDTPAATATPTAKMDTPPATSVATVPSTPVPSPTSDTATATREIERGARHTVKVGDNTIELPVGLTMEVFAENLGSPRLMAFDSAGVLYVTDSRGRVLRLPDVDEDGRADAVEVVASGLRIPHGIAFHQGSLYIAEESLVSRMIDENGDGFYESSEPIVAGLPDDGGHSTRTIRFGPDGALYVSIGSSCNICQEADPRRATIMRYEADGSNGRIYASGLRNAVGIFFDPTSGLFWATNNGSDGMGDDVPPETLNLVVDGGDYGWPRCHSGDIPDPNYGGVGACDGVTQPVVRMQAHSAPLGLTRMVGSALGPAWDGAMYIAFHGSWNRSIPTGYKVVALPMAGDTPTGVVLDFATGWLLPDGTWWGRPVDVIQAPNGSMLISDDAGGRIFRVFPLQGADED